MKYKPFFALLLTILAGIWLGEPVVRGEEPTGVTERLDADNFSQWCELIRTRDSELAWQQLPWLASFHQGLVEAARENKPLLLWVMNGHPMGCT